MRSPTRLAIRLAALWALVAASCAEQPGLGHQLAAHDIAYSVTQRGSRTIPSISSKSLRSAVWDRLDLSEFGPISALLAHGQQLDVVDTEFHDQEAIIVVRGQSKQQYRIYVIFEDADWFVDDVLREAAPLQYVSMRRQVEAILAVRDFRRALERRDMGAMTQACSAAFSGEVWRRMDSRMLEGASTLLEQVQTNSDGSLDDVFTPRDGNTAAKVHGKSAELTFYFVKERGRLVVDDVADEGAKATVRVRLRDGI